LLAGDGIASDASLSKASYGFNKKESTKGIVFKLNDATPGCIQAEDSERIYSSSSSASSRGCLKLRFSLGEFKTDLPKDKACCAERAAFRFQVALR
jgi:hypothetical protein